MRYRYILPNAITASRLLLAILLPFCDQAVWLGIVLAAACSDLLDGWLARRWGAVSWQGGLLDAVADKVFALAVLSLLVTADKIALWWLPLLLLREMAVGLTAVYLAWNRLWSRFRHMPARLAGKIATACQFTLAITVLVGPHFILPVCVLAALCSALAAFDYWRLFSKELQLQAKKRERIFPVSDFDASC